LFGQAAKDFILF